MHPLIRAFPSAHFYGARLRDAPVLRCARAWHADARFAPLLFLDLASAPETAGRRAPPAPRAPRPSRPPLRFLGPISAHSLPPPLRVQHSLPPPLRVQQSRSDSEHRTPRAPRATLNPSASPRAPRLRASSRAAGAPARRGSLSNPAEARVVAAVLAALLRRRPRPRPRPHGTARGAS